MEDNGYMRKITVWFFIKEKDYKRIGYKFENLNEDEVRCLIEEFHTYKGWLRLLLNGDAPFTSYDNSNIADQFKIMSKANAYQCCQIVADNNIDLSKYVDIEFEMYFDIRSTGSSYASELLLEKLTNSSVKSVGLYGCKIPEYDEQPLGAFADFLYDKFNTDDELSLGFRALPLTDKLIKEWLTRFNIHNTKTEKY